VGDNSQLSVFLEPPVAGFLFLLDSLTSVICFFFSSKMFFSRFTSFAKSFANFLSEIIPYEEILSLIGFVVELLAPLLDWILGGLEG